MRIILVGAVESSLTALGVLAESGHIPVAVVTLPLAKASRHSDFADIRLAARRQGIAVIEATDVNAAGTLDALRALDPDFIFVIGWSQICKPEFLNLPKHGCIGYHPALLPENRGRAVIAWTILQNATRSGGSLFWLADGVDSGDLLLQKEIPIAADETARTLMDRHLDLLKTMLPEALNLLASGNLQRVPQDESKATYCARRTPDDGLIDWTRPAREIWTLIRAAGPPYPGAFTYHGDHMLKIYSADLAPGLPYWGLPGQVQGIATGGVLVQCGDREHVLLKRVAWEGGVEQCASGAGLKVHSKLRLPAMWSAPLVSKVVAS